jgi:P4 family phage/plasmid primase-like protien
LSDPTTSAELGPYARVARTYRDLGWLGVIPVTGKHPPIAGYTGRGAPWPTTSEITAWITSRVESNVALRLPSDVIGIDIDAYDGRRGLSTLDLMEQDHGPLPPTWTTTSRTDGSGIRWYRVPPNVPWVGNLGQGSHVDIVHSELRYAVVWPSVHPITQREYLWYGPNGLVSANPPRPEMLPELPQPWVLALRSDSSAAHQRRAGRDGLDHATDDVAVVDFEGRTVDPEAVLIHGLPIGNQQDGLFRYLCSLRERRCERSEMIALGMQALQLMENAVDREPWTPEHIFELVDRVRREYPPGKQFELDPELRALAARLAGISEGVASAIVSNIEVTEPELREANATDLGNTLRFIALHRDVVRYAADVDRWYLWDGQRWTADKLGRVVDLTKNVIDAIRAEALLADADRDTRDRWLTWARNSEQLGRRRAMIEGARSEPGVVVTSDMFDVDPQVLVTRNGTVDLNTGELRTSRASDLCTHMADVEYVEGAHAPRWRAHVNFMCNGDPTLVSYIQRAVGYTLTGDVGERNFFFLEGTGSNGKNAFIEPLMQLMGSYAQAASTALLTGGDEQHPTILADLMGARLVFIDETRADKQLNVERLKALTGSKRVRARFAHKDFFEFDARFKLWIAGNGQPKIKDRSDGVWNRMHLVRCLGKIDDEHKIKNFGDLLYAEEAAGILQWALEGLVAWRLNGSLQVPASIVRSVDEYRDEEDYEQQFVDEHLLVTGNSDDYIVNDLVYQVYRRWAENVGLTRDEVRNRSHLGRSLARLRVGERDVVKVEGKTTRVLRGVRWLVGVNLFGTSAG